MTKDLLTLLLLGLLMSGCASPEYTQADNRVVWDERGCAYYVKASTGDNSFVRRWRSADKVSCND